MDNLFIDTFGLQGKDIWVVGGAGYLGQATVRLLQAAGARVLCIDLEGRGEAFVNDSRLAPQVTPAILDARDGKAIQHFVADQIQLRGVPHGLVNMAFASTGKSLEELTEEDFNTVNHGGITSTFLIARQVGQEMATLNRGSIVLFSSMYGLVSPDPDIYEAPMNKNPIEYGVGKAGIIQMTKYLAVHWGRQNVRCNCIAPGPFPNPSVQKNYPEFVDRLARKTPLGRIGQSPEIAGAVTFLLSDAATYMTGQTIQVDGGWTSW